VGFGLIIWLSGSKKHGTIDRKKVRDALEEGTRGYLMNILVYLNVI
jgi:hypothetical protein